MFLAGATFRPQAYPVACFLSAPSGASSAPHDLGPWCHQPTIVSHRLLPVGSISSHWYTHDLGSWCHQTTSVSHRLLSVGPSAPSRATGTPHDFDSWCHQAPIVFHCLFPVHAFPSHKQMSHFLAMETMEWDHKIAALPSRGCIILLQVATPCGLRVARAICHISNQVSYDSS